MTTLTCAEAATRFFAYLDRALAGETLDDLEAHLDTCLSCCDRLAFSRQLDTFVKDRLGDSPVPPGLAARVRRSLERTPMES